MYIEMFITIDFSCKFNNYYVEIKCQLDATQASSVVYLTKTTWIKTATSRRPLYWFFTPNPPNTKMTVKPRTNRKCKMWWFSILHEVHFIIIAPTEERMGRMK